MRVVRDEITVRVRKLIDFLEKNAEDSANLHSNLSFAFQWFFYSADQWRFIEESLIEGLTELYDWK